MTDLSSLRHLAQPHPVKSPTGTQLSCKNWLIEAAYRMIQNNLDPAVAENPDALVVYGGIGKAARNWDCFEQILRSLRDLNEDESLLIQSGKPVGVFRTHVDAPRVLLANSNLVPKWGTWEHFHELDRKGLMMYGQMTAGSWIYIGSQGIVQGTYETFVEAGRQHYGGSLTGKWILTAGLGGMGGAQPLAATFAGACSLNIECQQSRIDFRLRSKYLDEQARDLDDALARIARYTAEGKAVSVGLLGNAAEVLPELVKRALQGAGGIKPDLVTDQTSAHDLVNGYLPPGWTRRALEERAGRCVAARDAARRGRAGLRHARARDARVPGDGHSHGRLRQQHPPGGVRCRRQERVRFPGFRAGLHQAAVLPRQGAVPLGGAVGRPRRHPQDRPQDEGVVPRRRAPAPLARHGRRAHRVPGPAGAHLLDRPRRAASRGPGVQRDGEVGRVEGADRDRPRSPRLRLGGLAEPRDRSHARRLAMP